MKPLKYLNWIEQFYIKIALIILFYPLFSFYSNNIFAGEVYNSEIGAKIVKTNKDNSIVSSILGRNNYYSYSITTCPGEDTRYQMNISWAVDTIVKRSSLLYTTTKDKQWKKATIFRPDTHFCDLFDNKYSKLANGDNFYEEAKFIKCNAELKNLKANTNYMYKIINDSCSNAGDKLLPGRFESDIHYFKTSGSRKWSACIISDFHSYPPLPERTNAAMKMIKEVKKYDDKISWILHLGDICAWGGSYSFWKELYNNEYFKEYMWAGVNGNHDNMSRKYELSNNYFRFANFYPSNGYEGEEGVSYYFNYSGTLFIMLNSEKMRNDEGVEAAQKWVREVIKKNLSDFIVVCEHYQWFFGNDGSSSQYERWRKLFDECGVDLALAGNTHIYVRTNAIYNGVEVSDSLGHSTKEYSNKGTVYLQTPSSDNERGVSFTSPLKYNKELIRARWTEGPNTVGAMHISVSSREMKLVLLNRNCKIIDRIIIKTKKKHKLE